MKKKKSQEIPTLSGNRIETSKPARAPKRSVVVDFPQEGEIVTNSFYTVRVGASPTERAEISVDGRDWEPCRESGGYWWYDWSGYNAGPHSLRVRIPGTGKRFVTSKIRQFTVLI